MNFANSSVARPDGTRPLEARSSLSWGCSSAFLVSETTLFTMSADVPAGAIRASHCIEDKPGNVSEMLSTAGNSGERWGEVTAINFSLPALRRGITGGIPMMPSLT